MVLMQGEIVQKHDVHARVQAVACAHSPTDIHLDVVFVGTDTGLLHMFKTPDC